MQSRQERQNFVMAKVLFQLEQDEDGFPPIKVEMINAAPLGDGLFKIENAPFFTSNISYNDVVKESPTVVSEQYKFEEVVEQSQFAALSIIIMDESMDSFLMDLFRGLGCVIDRKSIRMKSSHY